MYRFIISYIYRDINYHIGKKCMSYNNIYLKSNKYIYIY